MKTLAALIFCISVILLVYLSGATNQADRYLQTLTAIETYEKVECLEACENRELVIVVPSNEEVKVLARLIGETRTLARVEYQSKAGWFTVTDSNAQFLEVDE